VLALVMTACSTGEGEPEPPAAEGTWTRLADMPLSPRTSPQVGWTGEEVLVVGGSETVEPDDSGGGPGPALADGAAYDPETDTWRAIADAPVPVAYYFRSAMAGDVMVLQTFTDQGRPTGWLTYDGSEDRWRELPDPPRPVEDAGFLTAAEGRVAALTADGDVLLLDVVTGAWAEVPPDPVTPRLRAVRATVTDAGVFVCRRHRRTDGQTADWVVVDRWDGTTWTRFDGSRQVDCPRHWTGTRLVNADIQTATGLDGNPPFGGRLDPESGEWSALPDAPDLEEPGPDSMTVNAAAGPLIAGWGYVYDDDAGSWTPFGRPDSPVDGGTGAAIVDGRLLVFGGRDDDAGYDGDAGLSDHTWVWTPPE